MTPPRPDPSGPLNPPRLRFLPGVIRDRVFLPAYYDLVAEHVQRRSHGTAGLRVRVFALVADTVRVTLLGWVRGMGRNVRRALLVVVAATITLLVITLANRDDPGNPPPYVPTLAP